MKIVYFTTDWAPIVGGIATFSEQLAEQISQESQVESVQVVTLKNPITDINVVNSKLTVTRLKTRSFFGIGLEVFKHAWQYRHHDVFHSTYIFPVGLFTMIAGKILRKPTFVTLYGTDMLAQGSQKTKWLKNLTLKHVTRAIAFSQSTCKEVAKKYHFPAEKMAVIYPPVPTKPTEPTSLELSQLKTSLGITDNDKIVLFVGNLVRRKGAQFLIEALSKISDLTIKLLIVGDGKERQNLETQVKNLNLGDRVTFVGKKSATPYYHIAQMFSMPSYFDQTENDIEGLGIVYLEASQAGLPVIGTNSGGIPEAIIDGQTGFIVAPESPAALQEKIELLANDSALRESLGQAGKQFVARHFSSQKSVADHLALYRHFLPTQNPTL